MKDLPTELPAGLKLGAVTKRADVRDVLIYRDAAFSRVVSESQQSAGRFSTKPIGRAYSTSLKVQDLPAGAVVATSSTRRRAQLLALNPRLKSPDIRGNVLTRIQKLAENPDLDATILALAGITRLNYRITPEARLEGENIPSGLLATILDAEAMLPCVGQGAIGLEIRQADDRVSEVCKRLNDLETFQCVTAERAFLAGMGGGCQSPVAAYAEVRNGTLHLQALSFATGPMRRAQATGSPNDAGDLGHQLATELKP